jgi:hypothetical protein
MQMTMTTLKLEAGRVVVDQVEPGLAAVEID